MISFLQLLTVHVHSYQSHQTGQPDVEPSICPSYSADTAQKLAHLGIHSDILSQSKSQTTSNTNGNKDSEYYGPGMEDHFDITVYRNSDVIGGILV